MRVRDCRHPGLIVGRDHLTVQGRDRTRSDLIGSDRIGSDRIGSDRIGAEPRDRENPGPVLPRQRCWARKVALAQRGRSVAQLVLSVAGGGALFGAVTDLTVTVCNASFVQLFIWAASVTGPEGTPYDGGLFNVELKFPDNYPFKPPDVVFKTKVYHPSINRQTGEICADILKSEWKPTLDIKWILTILRQMLKEPSTDSPLEPEIAQQLQERPEEFAATAAGETQKYAC
mmetsp:Transcript_7382/g.20807  ORF Transcript_7382/g.20807 Transcript_7382/m.20807 type:complete len:230 (-) Transcript_7382:253-942(-)